MYSDELKDDMNPSNNSIIDRKWFTSDEMFLTFIQKLVNNQFDISDKEFLYIIRIQQMNVEKKFYQVIRINKQKKKMMQN